MSVILLILGLILFFIAVYGVVMCGLRLSKKEFGRFKERFLTEVGMDLEEMFARIEAERLFFLNMVSIFGIGLIMLLLTKNLIVAGICACAGLWLPKIGLKIAKQRRLKRFNEQLVDGITSLSNFIRSGFSLVQGIDMLIREMPPPISEEFGLMFREHKMGVSLEDALNNMVTRVGSDELKLIVTAILISRTTGGNLSEVLENIAHTIRERNKVQGKINALTAQGKMQGWVVGLMPLFLGIAVYHISPDLMRPMFHSLLGWGFIVVIIILEIIGAWLIKKIVTIDI
ncbi:MAG: type II secretion system F family protein [bacterium]|nr:type II secretion system F family protein [bacterium]